MTALFIAPHLDDETLFGAFTLQAHAPDIHVVTVLRPADYLEREAETAEALVHLGVPTGSWAPWSYSEDSPDWTGIRSDLADLGDLYSVVYAPADYVRGQPHHDMVGLIALETFEAPILYHTYIDGQRVCHGRPVPVEDPSWIAAKLRALACYRSQIRRESTRPHFMAGLEEWYA